MSTELDVIDPAVLSETERTELDARIDSLIASHKNNRQEINRLVFDSVSAMTVSEDYERQLANKKGLRRFLGGITGSNKKLQDKINSSRAAAQYASQQTLQRLAEQNLMSFDLITAVNNKLNTSVIGLEKEINEVYAALLKFFKQNRSDMIQLENRVAKLERNVNLLNWQASIEYQMFGETEYKELDDTAKVVCLVRDFYDISQGEWTTSDLLLLKAAMSEIGVVPNSKINYFSLIRELYERGELREKLLNGQNIVTLPQPDYLPVLCGVKKLEMLETEENYIVKTAAGLLSSHQVDVETRQISNDLTVNYLAQEGSVNINSEVDCYSLILEMLFSLRQAQEEGVFSGGVENVVDAETFADDCAPQSEEEHSPDEWYELGLKYEQGEESEQDWAKVVRCYEKAAEQGYAAAQCSLGECYYNGHGVVENRRIAAEWHIKAAEQGYAKSQLILGECYETGMGVDENQTLALAWYTKAAESGQVKAQCWLGKYYDDLKSKTSSEDTKYKAYVAKSEEWYKKAALQGDPEAQYRVGCRVYSFDPRVGLLSCISDAVSALSTFVVPASMIPSELLAPFDPAVEKEKEAFTWYQKAAVQGHAAAQYCLGRCYEGGIGTEENISQAKEWYRRAAGAGYKEAEERLKDLL